MANDVRHLSIGLLDILLFSFVKYLFKASAHFFTLDFCIFITDLQEFFIHFV